MRLTRVLRVVDANLFAIRRIGSEEESVPPQTPVAAWVGGLLVLHPQVDRLAAPPIDMYNTDARSAAGLPRALASADRGKGAAESPASSLQQRLSIAMDGSPATPSMYANYPTPVSINGGTSVSPGARRSLLAPDDSGRSASDRTLEVSASDLLGGVWMCFLVVCDPERDPSVDPRLQRRMAVLCRTFAQLSALWDCLPAGWINGDRPRVLPLRRTVERALSQAAQSGTIGNKDRIRKAGRRAVMQAAGECVRGLLRALGVEAVLQATEHTAAMPRRQYVRLRAACDAMLGLDYLLPV